MSEQDKLGSYIGVAELKDHRGWTPAMITQFLGEPDRTRPNPGGRNAPRVKMWLFARVEDIEATDAFRTRWRQAVDRRAAQQRSAPQSTAAAGTGDRPSR